MILVNYSDSDSDDPSTPTSNQAQDTLIASKKRKAEDDLPMSTTSAPTNKDPNVKRAPSLPSSFHSLYATNVRTSTTDDPSIHGGRKRQIVHVAGNWPSHIYLEWLPDTIQLKRLDDLIGTVQKLITPDSLHSEPGAKLTSFLRSPLSARLPLHISLSAPLVLSTATKEVFRDKLSNAIAAAKIGRVTVRPSSLDLVPNFEGSRWFLVIRVEDLEKRRMSAVLSVCNGVCDEFGLSTLYQRGGGVGVDVSTKNGVDGERVNCDERIDDGVDERAFHVSIAWILDEVSKEVRDEIARVELGELGRMEVEFDCVTVKIGNVVDNVPL